MIFKKLLYILSIIIFLNCKKSPSEIEPKNTNQKNYINSLNGAKLYEKPSLNEMVILIIPHGKEIILYDEEKINQSGNIFRKINFGGVSGYISEDFISEKIEKFYYLVNSRVGLNVRENPDSNSKILKVIPYGYIGEFQNRAIDIEDENVFWIQTEFNGLRGWIHSGFTFISKDSNSLEDKVGLGTETWFYRLYSNTEKFYLEEIPYSKTEKETLKKEIKFSNYTLTEIEYPIAEDNCEGPKSKLLFYNTKQNKYYSRKGIFKEDIINTNTPFQNSIYSNSQICNCCCELEDKTLYFLFEDKIIPIYYNENQKGACLGNGETSSVQLERENRFLKSKNKLFMHLKLPNCKFDELEVSSDGFGRKFTGFKAELFISLQKTENDIKIEKFYNEKIPAQYLEDWNLAK